MNNDELQKAIDDITRDSTASVPAESAPSDNEALVNEIAGTSQQVSGAEIPAAPAPVVPETPAMPPVMQEMAAAAAPVVPQPAPEPVSAPVSEAAPSADTVLASVAREARKELYPLLDRVQMSPEEKFDICMEVSADDKNAFEGALAAAKQITDENAKAEALLKIISAAK